jgi:hypothetical protein
MSDETCATCPWWSRSGEGEEGVPSAKGECRRLPARRAHFGFDGSGVDAHITGYTLTVTHSEMSCGAHPARLLRQEAE